MGRQDSRRGRGLHISEEVHRGKERDRGHYEERRRIEYEEEDVERNSTRTRRHREEVPPYHEVKEESRQRKRRRQEPASERLSTNERHHRDDRKSRQQSRDEIVPSRSVEVRRSDRPDKSHINKDVIKEPLLKNGSRKHSRRESPSIVHRSKSPSVVRRPPKRRPRDSLADGFEPVQLSPRADVSGKDVLGQKLMDVISFMPTPPTRVPGPPDPFHPPSSAAQLKSLLLIGFLGSQTPPAVATPLNPEIPIFRQRLAFPCPVHSFLITKYVREFFCYSRRVPNSFLRCIRNDVVAAQLRSLALDQKDPLIGLVPTPIKIEQISGGGVIVDTFDFVRCDRLVRAAFRLDHPSTIRPLWDRSRPLIRLPTAELERFSESDYSDLDDGLPKSLSHSFEDEIVTQFSPHLPYKPYDDNLSLLPPRSMMQGLSPPPTALKPGAQVGMATTGALLSSKLPTSKTTTAAPNIEDLLSAPSAKEKQLLDSSAELRDLLSVPTAKHSITTRTFQSRGGSKVQQICAYGTRQDCLEAEIERYNVLRSTNPHTPPPRVCRKIHFRRIMFPHTDLSLGDCSYLDTCRHMASCRFVHYEVDLDVGTEEQKSELLERMEGAIPGHNIGTVSSSMLAELPAQWITCDVRKIDWTIFKGKVKVMMADPPWDIHMDLPYGTMTDSEMRAMRLDQVQDEGFLFLWVTGRAMELGRECMQLWGYKRVEEIVWVKTNQLHRVIRTGRTGHWLNHSKEHCLVGIKGDPKLNRLLDTDLIVAEVRETSRKPDEIYRIIERLCPGPYKLELFGRPHNVRNNWITLGNQLDNIRLHDQQLIQRYNEFASRCHIPLYDDESDEDNKQSSNNS